MDRCESFIVNEPPLPPSVVSTYLEGGKIILEWRYGEDDTTKAQSLTYEVYAGTSQREPNVYLGEIGPNYTTARDGNVKTINRVEIPFPEGQSELYWGIRSVDSELQKGEWVEGKVTRDEEGNVESEVILEEGEGSEESESITSDNLAKEIDEGNVPISQISLFPSGKVVKYLMEKKMAEVKNDNVAATFMLRKSDVGADLQPAKVKVKGHSEQFFGAVANEESSTSNPSAYQEGQGEVTSTPLLSGEAGRGYESSTATPEFIAQNGTQTIYFYHWDHLGSVRLITSIGRDPNGDPNDTAITVSKHDYEPYGLELPGSTNTSGNTHQFTGHERDALSGLDFMHFRYYNSTMGRFMRPDNILGSLTNPQSFNRYSYVKGNPVNFNDPTGHEEKTFDMTNKPQGAGMSASNPITGEPDDEKEAVLPTDQPKKVGDEMKNESLSIINPVTGNTSIEKEEIRNDSSGSGEYMSSRTTVSSGKHEAVDIKAEVGTDLMAPVSGKVIDNPYVKKELAGINLSIETTSDKGTRVVVSMSHLQEKSVKAGDVVKQGDVVAKSGRSGNAGKTTPHVHFSIRFGPGKGEPLNPVEVLQNQGF